MASKLSVQKAQELYDRLQDLRFKKRDLTATRHAQLMAIPRYKKLCDEQGQLRESKRSIVSGWEEGNEELCTSIDSLDEKIKSTQFSLTNAMLDAMRDGDRMELTKKLSSGKMKKLAFEFRVKFTQLSLFD